MEEDKIINFINEPIQEEDKGELEDTLSYINTQLEENKPKMKDLANPEEVAKQEHTIDELTDVALKTLGKIDSKTDEIYDLFYKPLLYGKDHSDVSKQSLLDSQRIKVEMVNALAALAQAQAKLAIAKQKQSPSAGVFIDATSGKDVGISLHNLWESEKEN